MENLDSFALHIAFTELSEWIKKKARETCLIFLNKCKFYDNWDISILDALERQIFSCALFPLYHKAAKQKHYSKFAEHTYLSNGMKEIKNKASRGGPIYNME